jgi:O-antigen/teichoic acid export membrane protein
MVLTLAVARMLGVEQFGLLAFGYALSEVCLVLPAFGFDTLTVREVARRPRRASRFLVDVSAVKVAMYIPMAGVCALIVALTSRPPGTVFVFLGIFIVAAAYQHLVFACCLFRAMQRMEREAVARLVLASLLLVTGLAVLVAGYGLGLLVVSRIAVSFACLAGTVLFLRKDLELTVVRPSWRFARTLVRMSAPLAMFSVLVMVYASLNLVLLGVMKGDAEAGYYSAAFKIIAVLLYVPASIVGAALPALSEAWKKDGVAFGQLLQRCVRYLLVLAVPISVGTVLVGERAIVLFFGREYLPSAVVITVLALCLVPDFLNYCMSAALIAMNRQKSAVIAALTGGTVTLGSCFLLIPRWGAVGAAASLAASMTVVCGVQLRTLFNELSVTSLLVTASRAAMAAGVMGAGLIAFGRAGVPLAPLVGGAVVLYGGSLWVLGEVKAQEVMQGYRVLRGLAGAPAS